MRCTVLVVEDDPAHAEMIETVLATVGCATIAVTSGADALPLVAAAHPDVVVLDIMLPGLNGLEVLLALGEHYPDLAVICVSAYPMERATAQVRELKHAPRHLQYLAKPYNLDTLYAAVECAVSGEQP